jgi:hypothetical protein
MRLKEFMRRVARQRRLRFGSVYARVIEAQPRTFADFAGDGTGNDRQPRARKCG